MKAEHGRVIVKGSHRAPHAGEQGRGKLDANERIEVTVRLRARQKWAGTPECAGICAAPLARRLEGEGTLTSGSKGQNKTGKVVPGEEWGT